MSTEVKKFFRYSFREVVDRILGLPVMWTGLAEGYLFGRGGWLAVGGGLRIGILWRRGFVFPFWLF